MDEEAKIKRPPAVAPLARAQLTFELISFLLCVLATAAQLGLLDFYFVHYSNEKLWLIWIVADCVVLAVMCWLLHFAITYNRRCFQHPCTDEANLKYAFVVWLVYSVVLSAKIAVFFPMFGQYLLPEAGESEERQQLRSLWGPVVLKFILAMSAVIFLLLVLSHHYNRLNNPRALYLSFISSTITIDLLDSALFLELLVEDTVAAKLQKNLPLKIIILIFACLNFMLPTFSLYKLKYRKGVPKWLPFPYEKLYALFYFLFVNVPYLVIRAYLWRQEKHDVSIFLVKNVLMVIVGMRDVWIGFLVWREKRALREHKEQGENNAENENAKENRDGTSASSEDKLN